MRKPFFPRKGPRTGRSIFGTIFVSLLAVLAVLLGSGIDAAIPRLTMTPTKMA